MVLSSKNIEFVLLKNKQTNTIILYLPKTKILKFL